MRLLISAGLFYPSKLGGPANTLYWLAKGLISNSIDVSVVTSNKYIKKGLVEFDSWIYVDNIRVRYCTANSKLNHKIIWHSIKELRNCEAIILSSFFYLPSFFIALFAAFGSKKIIWSPRGELFESAIKGSRVKLLFIKLLKILFSKRIVFHTTSFNEQNQIEKYLGNKVKTVVIPNYIELPRHLERNNINDNYFLFVGRIAPIKALDVLFLGLAKSEAFFSSDYKLIIAGGVEKQFEGYYKQLQQKLNENKLLQDKVFFLGEVEGKEKFQLYANAYFTILVSNSENFGNVITEALSQGTPVIASKGTPWKKLVDNKAGFWINNNQDDIASCITEAIKMCKEEYLQYRNNAIELAKEFDVFQNIRNWLEVIQK